MNLKITTICVLILGLSLPATADILPSTASSHFPTILTGPDHPLITQSGDLSGALGFGVNDMNHADGILLAQNSQPTEKDIADAKNNLSVVKERLANRQQALVEEEEAIKAEAADIKKTFGPQTLQGSRAQKYRKRMSALKQRQVKYMDDQKKLQYDIDTYNAAVKDMKTSVANAADETPGAETDEPEVSAAETADREALKNRIEQDRKELAAEYKALIKEKQKIAAAGAAAKPGDKGPSIGEQMKTWNGKMADYAKQRDTFNNAVKSYNATTGENLKIIPKP